MTNPASIALGLGLLFLPLWVLRTRGARLAGFDQRAWPRGAHLPLALVDALRAALGTWVLMRGLPGLASIGSMGRWQEPALLAAVIGVGLVVQALTWRDEDFVFAPVPYLLGVVAVVAHPIVLAIVLPMAVGAAMAVRAWSAGLIGGGVGLAVVGLAVKQQEWRLSLLVGVSFFLPVLASVMVGRHIGWPRK